MISSLDKLNFEWRWSQSEVLTVFFSFFSKCCTCSSQEPSATNDTCVSRAAALLSQPLVQTRAPMPYTHRMSSRLRLFLEQYAQGVSGRAAAATCAPRPTSEHSACAPVRHYLLPVSCLGFGGRGVFCCS